MEGDLPCGFPGNASSPGQMPWKSMEEKAIHELFLHLYSSRSAGLGSLLFISLVDIHLSPQLAVNVLSDIPLKLCKLLLSWSAFYTCVYFSPHSSILQSSLQRRSALLNIVFAKFQDTSSLGT